MARWKKYEKECCDFIIKEYGDFAKFCPQGGSNSTVSDVLVLCDNQEFFIEIKEPKSQCGQFVVIEDNGFFIYSPRNKTIINQYATEIINFMNLNFAKYSNITTAGIKIEIDSSILVDWIKKYYSEQKKVKYFVSGNSQSPIIFNVQNFEKYFDVIAKYRIKRSGSSNVSKKNRKEVCVVLNRDFNIDERNIRIEENKLIVETSAILEKHKFSIGVNSFQLSKISSSEYVVRQLSKTKNANVIFSISLKKNTIGLTKEEFLKDLA